MPRSKKATPVVLPKAEIKGHGPAPIPQGQGKKLLEQTYPDHELTLDAGVFDWLWRIVEAKYAIHKDAVGEIHELTAEVAARAVAAFRIASGQVETEEDFEVAAPPPAPKKVLLKKPAPTPGKKLLLKR